MRHIQKGQKRTSHYCVRFQVLTAASIKMRAFWDIAKSSLVGPARLHGTMSAGSHHPIMSSLPSLHVKLYINIYIYYN